MLARPSGVLAIEVASGPPKSNLPELAEFAKRSGSEHRGPSKPLRSLLIGAGGLQLETALSIPAGELLDLEMTRPLGVRAGVDLTKALRLASELEDEETIRKLELGD